MNHEWTKLPNHDKECFACGTKNSFGLKMSFASNGEQLRSILTVPEHTRGWNNLVHGGILATILDEIMSWTAMHFTNHFILTRNITISFKKPVFIDTQLTATCFISKREGKNASLKANIQDDSSTLCCSGEGEFVLFTPQEFAHFNIIPQDDLVERALAFTKQP